MVSYWILAVLRLECRVGTFRCELLNVRVALLVERHLRGKPGDIRRRLVVIRFQYFGVLLCGRERRLQLRDLVLEWRRVDLKQHVVFLHRHVGLDRDCDDLSRHIRRHFHYAAGHRHTPGRGEVVKKREKCREDKPAHEQRNGTGQPAPSHQLEFREHEPQRDDVKAKNDEHGWPLLFLSAMQYILVEVAEAILRSRPSIIGF